MTEPSWHLKNVLSKCGVLQCTHFKLFPEWAHIGNGEEPQHHWMLPLGDGGANK